jgi:hypothetical protein
LQKTKKQNCFFFLRFFSPIYRDIFIFLKKKNYGHFCLFACLKRDIINVLVVLGEGDIITIKSLGGHYQFGDDLRISI